MEKDISIYLKDEMIRILPIVTTTQDISLQAEPVFFLKSNDPVETIGRIALEAFDYCRTGFPHPSNQHEFTLHSRSINKAMKIKTWKAFKLGAKVLDVSINNNVISIHPYKNEGVRAGFTPLDNEKVRTCSLDPAELGQAILDAFKDCE